MAGCSDQRFERMLYAYELGMLGDPERQELELHLLECDHCFDSVREFAPEAEILRYDDDVRISIGRIVDGADGQPTVTATTPRRRMNWPNIVRASLAVAALLVLFIIQPWQFEIKPTQTAVAAEHRLAVMYFDNLVDADDTDRLGEIVTDLLITNLSESHHMEVVSAQRLYDALKLLGLEGVKKIDRNVASEVARLVNARWLLTGSILQLEPEIILTAQLIEVSDGDVIGSQRISGDPEQSVLSVVDRLTIAVQMDLKLPIDEDTSIPSGTDFSLSTQMAYRHYLEGMENFNRYYFREAAASFRKAIEIDSTFAMAYYHLALVLQYPISRDMIAQAMHLRDRVGRRERILIESRSAELNGNAEGSIALLKEGIEEYPNEKRLFFRLGSLYDYMGKPVEGLPYLVEALEIDPLYKEVLNHLSFVYVRLDSIDRAIETVDRLVEAASDEANPWDSRGMIYASAGLIEEAIASYQKALEIKPDFYFSITNLGELYLSQRRYDEAEAQFRVLTSCPNQSYRANGRRQLVHIPFYQGRYDQALVTLDEVVTAERVEIGADEVPVYPRLRSLIYIEKGDLAAALEEARRSQQLARQAPRFDSVYGTTIVTEILAMSGRYAEAEEAAQVIKRADQRSGFGLSGYNFAMGFIELHRGNLKSAEDYLVKSLRESDYFPARQVLGRVFLESGQYEQAILHLEAARRLSIQKPEDWGIVSLHAVYYLAQAYENSGRHEDAMTAYREYLTAMAEADPGIEMVADAQVRLNRLESSL